MLILKVNKYQYGQQMTAVWRNGSFRFSVAGKSKAGNLSIFTQIRSTCRR